MTSNLSASMTNYPKAGGATQLPPVLHQLGEVLTRQAALLIDMIVPGLSRVYRPSVFLANTETASTNGSLWIRMPIDFLGLNYPGQRVESAPVWLGLLAHEFGHWLQPLEAMTEVEKELHLPSWLTNILLDIHCETLVAGLFPGLELPLTAKRSHIGRVMSAEYLEGMKNAGSFQEALCSLALYHRFCHDPASAYSTSLRTPVRLGVDHSVAIRVKACAETMRQVVEVRAEQLPDFLRHLITQYPELSISHGKHAGGDQEGQEPTGTTPMSGPASSGNGGASTSSGGSVLPALRKLMGLNLPEVTPEVAESYSQRSREYVGEAIGVTRPSTDAVRLANKLMVRFTTPGGMLRVPAPGRLDRLAALHQDPLPFRLELPSRFGAQPASKVVLHVDHSSSMDMNNKWERALLAAQAISQAILRAGGDVRAVLFEGHYYHTADYSADALFAHYVAGLDMTSADGLDTSFAWMPAVWRRFPDHIHIILTDGSGYLPLLIPERDRKRTFAIVIPDGNPELIASMAAKVVVITDLDRLPGAFAFLAPRQWVA